MITKQEFTILRQTILDAGAAIMDIYRLDDFDAITDWKADHSPLTAADKAANDIIVQKLKELFPDDAILSEEEEDNLERLNYARCWILDPLDGTKEFIKRNGEFTVNLALSIDGVSVWGMIYAPALNKLYWAQKDSGAWMQNNNDKPARIHVSNRNKNFRIVGSRSHEHPKMQEIINSHQDLIEHAVPMGSSLKGCLIAEGSAEIYIRHNPTMEWDTAAMQIIAEEAGGIFAQLDNTPMRYNRHNSLNEKGFYVVNNHENLLNFI